MCVSSSPAVQTCIKPISEKKKNMQKAVEKWKGGMEMHFYSKSRNGGCPLACICHGVRDVG